jgi:hypothetical protein
VWLRAKLKFQLHSEQLIERVEMLIESDFSTFKFPTTFFTFKFDVFVADF